MEIEGRLLEHFTLLYKYRDILKIVNTKQGKWQKVD
jgi:hypothetical protein